MIAGAEWLSLGAGGLSIGAGAIIAHRIFKGMGWLLVFFTGRQDKKEAQLDADAALIDGKKNALIDRLETDLKRVTERLAAVEAGLAECKELHAEERAKRLELEAFVNAQGQARQQAALIVAAEKLEQREKGKK